MKILAYLWLPLVSFACGTTTQDLGGDRLGSSAGAAGSTGSAAGSSGSAGFAGSSGSAGSAGSSGSAGAAGSSTSAVESSQLFAGGDVTCFRRADGVVKCWGHNNLGQLSAPSEQTCNGEPCTRQPVISATLAQASAIALGHRFGCAIVADGTTKCWGENSFGQLGRGTSDADAHRDPVPVAVTDVKALAAGAQHICALTQAGEALCWGLGESGQLGLDPASLATCAVPDTSRGAPGVPNAVAAACALEPSEVPAFRGAVQLALGDAHSCARFADGRVACIGRGDSGELGGGDRPAATFEPIVALASGADFLAVGGRHSCAVLGQRVRCWGANEAGQLGVGSTAQQQCAAGVCLSVPTLLADLPATRDLALGQSFSCARLNDGTARCWGSDAHGQVGNSSGPLERCSLPSGGALDCLPRPTQAAYGLTGAIELRAGAEHACARLDGEVRCWGSANNGQNGGHSDAPFPSTVYGLN